LTKIFRGRRQCSGCSSFSGTSRRSNPARRGVQARRGSAQKTPPRRRICSPGSLSCRRGQGSTSRPSTQSPSGRSSPLESTEPGWQPRSRHRDCRAICPQSTAW
jgi:hypothetical protein